MSADQTEAPSGIGYALANVWCYALGVMVVSVAEPGTELVMALLLAQGGLVALGLILIDELDNAYGDVYSGSVSTHSLLPRWSVKRWGRPRRLRFRVLTETGIVVSARKLDWYGPWELLWQIVGLAIPGAEYLPHAARLHLLFDDEAIGEDTAEAEF